MPNGRVERWDPALDALIAADAKPEKLAEGFGWAEGPVWIRTGNYLLLTDPPGNRIWKWSAQGGLEKFLEPSGGIDPDASLWREAGANGLYADGPDTVLAAGGGSRSVFRLNLTSKQRTELASRFEGKRFSSPNDVVRTRSGVLFFTDPPYGFRQGDASPLKEQPFNGVYRVAADGTVSVIERELTLPNGVGLSPDERTLYVSQSDPRSLVIMAYSLDEEARVISRRLFQDTTDLAGPNAPGNTDGMAIAADGTIFIGGPGGVLVLSADGRRLGRISTGKSIANCVFGDDGHTLYMTSSNMLARIRTRVRGAGFAGP